METILLLTAGLLTMPGEDKKMHFLAGAAVSLAAEEAGWTPLEGCLAALGVGLAKEALDSTGRGSVEAGDVLATSVGCGVTFRF